jgi:hypothetical protein
MKKVFLIIAAVILIAGCSENPKDSGSGRLSIKVTDDPFDISYVESATVTITKIEVRRAGLDTTDGNPFIVVWEDTLTIDLIDLRNGLTEEITNIEIPNGTYDLVRLYVDEAGLMLKGHANKYNMKVPSGRQTGIKIFISPAITVSGGLTAELLLDFDLSRSFEMRGNMHNPLGFNGFIFKPCVRAVNNTTAGRMVGVVTDSAMVKIVNAKVWLEKDTVFATSFTDTLGKYALIGIPAGTYSAFSVQDGYDTLSYNNINILAGSQTVQNFILEKK